MSKDFDLDIGACRMERPRDWTSASYLAMYGGSASCMALPYGGWSPCGPMMPTSHDEPQPRNEDVGWWCKYCKRGQSPGTYKCPTCGANREA